MECVSGEMHQSMANATRMELTVAHVVVERHVFAARLQGAGILDHLCVELVQIVVLDSVLDYHESVFVEASYGFLQVARRETAAGYFILARLDGCWVSGSQSVVWPSGDQTNR